MKPKIIARYLPQFHRVPENDEWWGDGFTEWTAVKAGEVLFEGHRQPKVPLNENYYNLLDKQTLQWQAKLAKEYCIDGFAFYHYWFKNGKQILEKPAQNLLKWKDIDLNFCFSWANETWARSWSKLMDVNTWQIEQKNFCSEEDDGILLEQKYGNEKEWMKHIAYLLPFFQDKRYIRYQGHPVFMIYRPGEMHCLPDMIDCWNTVLKKRGMPTLYVIGETQDECFMPSNYIDARLIRFPDCALKKMKAERLENGLCIYDYDEYWKTLLSREWNWIREEKTYICAAVDFDSTPRRGTGGIVLVGKSIEKFKKYFSRFYQYAQKNQMEYIFINAWNEWGEGMYLEPDQQSGFTYLEAVKNTVLQDFSQNQHECIQIMPISEDARNIILRWLRDRSGYKFLYQWILLKKQGKSVANYLKNISCHEIAIYGYGFLGKILVEELIESEIEILYIIDQNPNVSCKYCQVYMLSDKLEPVDIVVVSIAGQYSNIKKEIQMNTGYRTISLEHIVYELL